ncbi:unnamed protein product [Lymnaea stagnalis]|uniref:Ricin B lectin domain-containing protein n=1 Tax=Lymnaea stagnalis TaxID=6523 RepID=A0AAV2IJW0_LYMST
MTADGRLLTENYMLGLMDHLKHDKTKNKPRVYLDMKKLLIQLSLWKFKQEGETLTYCLWSYKRKQLVNTHSGLCLEADGQAGVALLRTCQSGSPLQAWELTTRDQRRDLLRQSGRVPIDWSV